MIRKSSARTETVLKEMFDGKGEFKQEHILSKDELGHAGRLYADCSLAVGGCVGGHVHKGDREICYFLSGRGRITDDNQIVEVGAGDTNIVFNGHFHKIENIGQEVLRYIVLILYD